MFTYDDHLTTNRDLLRFLSGDTVEAYAMNTDEELDATLAEFDDNPFLAAGWVLRDAGNSPTKVMPVRDAVAGGIQMATLLKMFADLGDRWLG